jgi:hypothetical protein
MAALSLMPLSAPQQDLSFKKRKSNYIMNKFSNTLEPCCSQGIYMFQDPQWIPETRKYQTVCLYICIHTCLW